MPLSTDPEKRARQLANLKPDAATKHGAFSRARIRRRALELADEYAASVPNATHAEVELQTHRWAQMELLREHQYERGVVRDRRKGTVYPAALLLEKVSAAWERQHAQLLEPERAVAAGNGSAQAQLNALLAELAAEDGK